MKPAIRFLSTIILSSAVIIMVLDSVAQVSPKKFTSQPQTQRLLEAAGGLPATSATAAKPMALNVSISAKMSGGVSERVLSGSGDPIKASVISGIGIYLDQLNGACFSKDISIGKLDLFQKTINDRVNRIIVGKEGKDWLEANSPGAQSAHYAWKVIGRTADIIFPFDPRSPGLTMTQRQTMMHEMTHHIEWLKGTIEDSKYKNPLTGTVTANPHSERNTDYQDKVVNALVSWKRYEDLINNKKMSCMEGLSAWKDLENAVSDLEAGSVASGNRHDADLQSMTGFHVEFNTIRETYLKSKCDDDFRILVMVADLVGRLDRTLQFDGLKEVTLGDTVSLKAVPYNGQNTNAPEVKLKPELRATFHWKISDADVRIGNPIDFTPTEAKPYKIPVELIIPFSGKEYVIANGDYDLAVRPSPTPASTPAGNLSIALKCGFSSTAAGSWQGTKNDTSFRLTRQVAARKNEGDCGSWPSKAEAVVWGACDPDSGPRTVDEIHRKLADEDAENRGWQKFSSSDLKEITLGGFHGWFLDTIEKYQTGGWSDGYRESGVSSHGHAYLISGNHLLELKYEATGTGCWNNSDRAFVETQAKVARDEAKAVLLGLTPPAEPGTSAKDTEDKDRTTSSAGVQKSDAGKPLSGRWSGSWTNELGEKGTDSLILTESASGDLTGMWSGNVAVTGKRLSAATARLQGRTATRSYEINLTVSGEVVILEYVARRLDAAGSYSGRSSLKRKP